MTKPIPPQEPGKIPTIRDVATRAGVAPGTVSNVLTGRKPVAEPLRAAVIEAVEALHYRTNQFASNLRSRRMRSIGVVVPDLTNPFFASLIQTLERLAARDRFQLLLMSSHEDDAQEIERITTLVDRQIDGLLIAPVGDRVEAALESLAGPTPVLVLDRGFGSTAHDTIASDNMQAAYDGTRYLLGLGHREIVFLATSDALANIRDRIEGFGRALAETGDAAAPRIVFGGLSVDSCRGAIEQELRRADRPSAIFAAAYVATLGAVKAIHAVDLAFPADISLLGFDDADWMTALRPYISTVEQSIEGMAEQAWAALRSRLVNRDRPLLHARIPCRLRIRESTRPFGTTAAGGRPRSPTAPAGRRFTKENNDE